MEMTDEIRVGDRFERVAFLTKHGGGAFPIGATGEVVEVRSHGLAVLRAADGRSEGCAVTDPERWRRLPRAAPGRTIEERRAALKVGDVIKDLALLCEGLRADYGWLKGCDPMVIGANGLPTTGGWTAGDRDMFHRSVIAEGLVFLGWATEEKPAAESRIQFRVHGLGCSGAPCTCGAPYREVNALASAPKSKALPFRYLDDCSNAGYHNGEVSCGACEETIAERMKKQDKDRESPKPPRFYPPEPMRSGLGNGVVGGWNKRAVR